MVLQVANNSKLKMVDISSLKKLLAKNPQLSLNKCFGINI